MIEKLNVMPEQRFVIVFTKYKSKKNCYIYLVIAYIPSPSGTPETASSFYFTAVVIFFTCYKSLIKPLPIAHIY